VTGISIEIFFADTALETFGWEPAGWFWQLRRRGFPPDGRAVGPFPTSYSAYRDALIATALNAQSVNLAMSWSSGLGHDPTLL
jgi:hypothetical protein